LNVIESVRLKQMQRLLKQEYENRMSGADGGTGGTSDERPFAADLQDQMMDVGDESQDRIRNKRRR